MNHPWSSDVEGQAAIRRAEPDNAPTLTHADVPRAVERLAERVARLEALLARDAAAKNDYGAAETVTGESDAIKTLTAERDAAIRERDKLRSDMAFNCDLSSLAASETERLRARVRELEEAGEPVAWGVMQRGDVTAAFSIQYEAAAGDVAAKANGTVVPLYAAPQHDRVVRLPDWVGLPSGEDIRERLTAAGVRWEIGE